MTNDELLDLYSDYLISAFGQTTGTGLSALLDGAVSHDRVQRFLASPQRTAADLWHLVKPHVRALQSADAVLVIDDSIAEKPYTDENAIVCWHWDHVQSRRVKGINFLSALYHSQGVSLPVGYALVAKTEHYRDQAGQSKRRSPVSKQESYQQLVQQAVVNRIPFQYVLNDVWYASAENMRFVKDTLGKEFVMPLKANRKVAENRAAKLAGRYVRVDTLPLEPNVVQEIYLEGVAFPLRLIKQVFTHEDGSCGIQYLVSSDPTLSSDAITSLYRTRGNVEVYHKSLKQNASLEKAPAQTVRTLSNHFFAALCGYVKLELLRGPTRLNHFALRAKLYLRALHVAFDTLRQLQPIRLSA